MLDRALRLVTGAPRTGSIPLSVAGDRQARKVAPVSEDEKLRQKPFEYARAALNMMEQQGIPPKPNNFAVWYRYFSGAYPELTRALDVIIDDGLPFTDERSAEVYDQFLGIRLEDDFLDDATARIETEVMKLMKHAEAAGQDAEAYGDTLSTVSGRLSSDTEIGNLQQIMEQVLAATRTMEDRNQLLQNRLKESAGEIQSLKEDVESLRHEALTDGLTGVANRKFFDEEIRLAAAEASDTGTPLTLLMVDIDHFKNFNDTHGHQVGDQVLRFVAKILKGCVRTEDLTARYGGEEFSIILRNTDLVNGSKVGQKVRTSVSKKTILNRSSGESLGTITVSIGTAQFTQGESIEAWIERADQALYQAKQNGRNRVEMAEAPDTPVSGAAGKG